MIPGPPQLSAHRPLPARPGPCGSAARRRGTHARLSGSPQPGNAPSGRPVRGRPWKTSGVHRPSCGPDPVRYASVDTATHRRTGTHTDTWRDKTETARQRENTQLAGRFPRVWQVLGSNQRRLSRRFYSPLAPPQSPPADLRLWASRLVSGVPSSAMRPWAPNFGAEKSTDRGRKSTDENGGSGYTDRIPRL
jgi:hypothetical protein